MTQPMLGVVMPAWNAAPWIADALRSLMDQSSRDWQCVIVDDGSTDGTPEAVAIALRRIGHNRAKRPRIEVHTIAHSGLPAAVNIGMGVLGLTLPESPSLVTVVAADDMVSRNYVATMLAANADRPLASGIFPRVCEFGARSMQWSPGEYSPGRLRDKNILPGCTVWRRQVWDGLSGYLPDYTDGCEDWDFAARGEATGAFRAPYMPLYAPQATYYHCAHAHSLSARMTPEYRTWVEGRIAAYFPPPVEIKSFVPEGSRLVITPAGAAA